MGYKLNRNIQIVSALILGLSFFMPWVDWEGTRISGMSIATGEFFSASDSKYGLSNPFPQVDFLFFSFWLIPVLAAGITVFFVRSKKLTPFISFVTGSLSLALTTTYILFSNTLLDLGAGSSLTALLKPGLFIHSLAAIMLIVTAFPVKQVSWKIGWLLLGPVLAFVSFKIIEKYVLAQTHEKTELAKADYEIRAEKLISEFLTNDTAANNKYREKIIEVAGNVSGVEISADSSSTLKFADSTGSYAIFSFEKEQLLEVKKIRPESEIILKGVCSGSIYSEILGTTSISFKRSAIIKR